MNYFFLLKKNKYLSKIETLTVCIFQVQRVSAQIRQTDQNIPTEPTLVCFSQSFGSVQLAYYKKPTWSIRLQLAENQTEPNRETIG